MSPRIPEQEDFSDELMEKFDPALIKNYYDNDECEEENVLAPEFWFEDDTSSPLTDSTYLDSSLEIPELPEFSPDNSIIDMW